MFTTADLVDVIERYCVAWTLKQGDGDVWLAELWPRDGDAPVFVRARSPMMAMAAAMIAVLIDELEEARRED
jgi:hypothetical protein